MKYEAKWAVKEVGKDYSKYSAEFPGYFLQIFLKYRYPVRTGYPALRNNRHSRGESA